MQADDAPPSVSALSSIFGAPMQLVQGWEICRPHYKFWAKVHKFWYHHETLQPFFYPRKPAKFYNQKRITKMKLSVVLMLEINVAPDDLRKVSLWMS